jgi:hypothetical protein
MKKKVIPFAVVSSLAFAPLTAGAVEYNEVKEQYPATTSWTEVDWNNYLEENHGSKLDDYDTMNELEEDIGAPIDVNQLADGNLDQNVLDIIERYNMDTSELAAFLEEYDNRDNIHFAGDLVKALDDGGIVDENGTDDTNQNADADNSEGLISDNDNEGNESDQNSEGTVSDKNNEANTSNNNEDNTSNDTDANSQNEDTTPNSLDEAQLEETYLVPLGWTVDEFNQYLSDNYETDLNDYTLFNDLEAEVGPLITDENELELIEQYGLTPEEYEVLLAEYGESPDDYYFLNDLRESLDYYTSDQPEEAGTEKGGDMPDTATNSLAYVLLGAGLIMLGGITLRVRKRYGDN